MFFPGLAFSLLIAPSFATHLYGNSVSKLLDDMDDVPGVTMPYLTETVPYQQMIDPFLVEASGNDEIRASIFSEQLSLLGAEGFKKFEAWYQGHFLFTPDLGVTFHNYMQAAGPLLAQKWKDLHTRHLEQVFRSLALCQRKYPMPGKSELTAFHKDLHALLHGLQHKLAAKEGLKNPDLWSAATKDFSQVFAEQAYFQKLAEAVRGLLFLKVKREFFQPYLERAEGTPPPQPQWPCQHLGEVFYKGESTVPFQRTLGCESQEVELFFVASKNAKLKLELHNLPAPYQLSVHHTSGEGHDKLVEQKDFTDRFQASKSGEYRVKLRFEEKLSSRPIEGTLSCKGPECQKEVTRFPVIALHGMLGGEKWMGVKEYWKGFAKHFHPEPHDYQMHVVETHSIGRSEKRAIRLYPIIQKILHETRASKVHFLCHSQGGLDARILVSGLGLANKVASITTIGTPHRGVKIDMSKFWTRMDFRADAMEGFFNKNFPLVPQIPLLSYAGIACSSGDKICQEVYDAPKRRILFLPFFKKIKKAHQADSGFEAYQGYNDGLVPVSSAFYGTPMLLLPADHADQVWGGKKFDHLQFYTSHLHLLRRLEVKASQRFFSLSPLR